MKMMTITFEDAMHAALLAESQKTGVPMAEIIRRAIEKNMKVKP